MNCDNVISTSQENYFLHLCKSQYATIQGSSSCFHQNIHFYITLDLNCLASDSGFYCWTKFPPPDTNCFHLATNISKPLVTIMSCSVQYSSMNSLRKEIRSAQLMWLLELGDRMAVHRAPPSKEEQTLPSRRGRRKSWWRLPKQNASPGSIASEALVLLSIPQKMWNGPPWPLTAALRLCGACPRPVSFLPGRLSWCKCACSPPLLSEWNAREIRLALQSPEPS